MLVNALLILLIFIDAAEAQQSVAQRLASVSQQALNIQSDQTQSAPASTTTTVPTKPQRSVADRIAQITQLGNAQLPNNALLKSAKASQQMGAAPLPISTGGSASKSSSSQATHSQATNLNPPATKLHATSTTSDRISSLTSNLVTQSSNHAVINKNANVKAAATVPKPQPKKRATYAQQKVQAHKLRKKSKKAKAAKQASTSTSTSASSTPMSKSTSK